MTLEEFIEILTDYVTCGNKLLEFKTKMLMVPRSRKT